MLIPNESDGGSFYNEYRALLEEFYRNRLPQSQLRAFQQERLARVVAYAREHSPFYRKALAQVNSLVTIESLPNLPFTTKDDLRSQGEAILCKPVKTQGIYYETTGTTGKATPCPRNVYDLMRITTSIRAGLEPLLREVMRLPTRGVGIMGPSELHSTGDTMGSALMDLGFGVFKIWPNSPVIGYQKALEVLKRYELDVVLATPGVVQMLYKACRKYGYDPSADFNLKVILLIGEMCTEQFQKNMEAIWGARVHNFLYGSQEVGHAAVCCRNKHFHVLPFNYIYEVVDVGGGGPVASGRPGELVLTMLQENSSKPLIRYRTGDVCVLDSHTGCSELQSPIVRFKGRTKDIVNLSGVDFFASEIEEILMSPFANCLGYQLDIDCVNGKDVVEIRLEFAGSEDSESLDILRKRWRERVGSDCRIVVVPELDAITNVGALVSWKAARILDRRVGESAEALTARRIAQTRKI